MKFMTNNNSKVQGRFSSYLRQRLAAYSFILPAAIIFLFIITIPTIMGIGYSFTNWSGSASNVSFIGFDNYRRVFRDPVFFTAIKNTVFITVFVVLLQNLFGLLLAVALNREMAGRNFFKAVFFIPSLLSIIVVGYTWIYIMNVHVGIYGTVLKAIGVSSVVSYDLFMKPLPALLLISFTMVWQYSGYNMTIYLSGLQAIPAELYEAAVIDGCNSLQKFRNVTLPLIMPSITIGVFLNMIGCLKLFEQVYIMTKGGPASSTETIGTFIYNSAFSGNQMGYGTAISTILFIGTMIIAITQVKLMRAREVEL